MKESPASGHHGDKIAGGRDLGAGSGAPKSGGSGFLTKSKTSRDLGSGSKGAPVDTGHSTGVAKIKGASGDAKRLKADGVGGPLPSA
jgi:hypothetical protein